MGTTSAKLRGYQSAKGKMHSMTTTDIYYKIVEVRNCLFDITNNHKKWGTEWYRLATLGLFAQAQLLVGIHGKGDMVAYTIRLIDELAELEATLIAMERGCE